MFISIINSMLIGGLGAVVITPFPWEAEYYDSGHCVEVGTSV
jgi:hypothetical protein